MSGLWTWDGTFPISITDAEGYYIVSPGGMMPSGEKNARLISAAPDLLHACKVVAELAVCWEALTPDDIAEVRAAIAKAEGQ